MKRIYILHVGNLKEKYYTEAVLEYEKRLQGFCRIENIFIKEEAMPENPSEAQIRAAVNKEGGRIRDTLNSIGKQRIYKIALCIEGKRMSSEKFASSICADELWNAYSGVAFIIGGSCGLSEEVKHICEQQLSFSEMTFPHRLMRVILLEQIYRGFSINAGNPYHK